MEMNQIRYFLALCDELNFTRAARRCGVAQPSLTKAIKALERELRGALFHRTPAVRLTVLGEAVRPLLERVAVCVEHTKRLASRRNGRTTSHKRGCFGFASGRAPNRTMQ